ncbi:MAG TPA: PEGA domain-containing protein, partial [Labilithrix sp.]|nr:PEGA domain-containing protein [Labilithrix sp.]
MRPLALVLLSVALLAAPRVARAQRTTPGSAPPPARTEDLARARSLDQQGARAYGDGRYNDAIRYFEESHRLGGPPFELWNIAKCHAKLDQPDQAAEMLERYLATPTLPTEDREEATQQLEALRRRPSTLTLASTPAGATVLLDGKPVEGSARTPTSFQVSPGAHTIALSAPDHATHIQTVEARYGRAIILDVPLGKARRPPPPQNPYPEDTEVRRLALRGHLGVMLPRYGSVGGAAHVTGTLSGTYRIVDLGATALEAGLLFAATGDSWDNTVGAAATVAPCGALNNARSASAYSVFAMGGASWELAARLR